MGYTLWNKNEAFDTQRNTLKKIVEEVKLPLPEITPSAAGLKTCGLSKAKTSTTLHHKPHPKTPQSG